MIPAPRCPTDALGSLSITRTGMPFLRRVSAVTSPAGPAPTYVHHRVVSETTITEPALILTTRTGTVASSDMLSTYGKRRKAEEDQAIREVLKDSRTELEHAAIRPRRYLVPR